MNRREFLRVLGLGGIGAVLAVKIEELQRGHRAPTWRWCTILPPNEANTSLATGNWPNNQDELPDMALRRDDDNVIVSYDGGDSWQVGTPEQFYEVARACEPFPSARVTVEEF